MQTSAQIRKRPVIITLADWVEDLLARLNNDRDHWERITWDYRPLGNDRWNDVIEAVLYLPTDEHRQVVVEIVKLWLGLSEDGMDPTAVFGNVWNGVRDRSRLMVTHDRHDQVGVWYGLPKWITSGHVEADGEGLLILTNGGLLDELLRLLPLLRKVQLDNGVSLFLNWLPRTRSKREP